MNKIKLLIIIAVSGSLCGCALFDNIFSPQDIKTALTHEGSSSSTGAVSLASYTETLYLLDTNQYMVVDGKTMNVIQTMQITNMIPATNDRSIFVDHSTVLIAGMSLANSGGYLSNGVFIDYTYSWPLKNIFISGGNIYAASSSQIWVNGVMQIVSPLSCSVAAIFPYQGVCYGITSYPSMGAAPMRGLLSGTNYNGTVLTGPYGVNSFCIDSSGKIYEADSSGNSLVWFSDVNGSYNTNYSLTNITSMVNSLNCSGGSLYSAGYFVFSGTTNACYWQDTTLRALQLPVGVTSSIANYIGVAGSDVFVSGFYVSNSVTIYTVWKNGFIATNLPAGSSIIGMYLDAQPVN